MRRPLTFTRSITGRWSVRIRLVGGLVSVSVPLWRDDRGRYNLTDHGRRVAGGIR